MLASLYPSGNDPVNIHRPDHGDGRNEPGVPVVVTRFDSQVDVDDFDQQWSLPASAESLHSEHRFRNVFGLKNGTGHPDQVKGPAGM
ncbi:hypothetical protein V3C33_20795 (plasmid) [Micrococcaceae bacterium Sec5.7]